MRRWGEVTPTFDLLRTYGDDYRVIFVGDASMGPYEITEPGASVEHWNEESGSTWMRRVLRHWPRAIWLNPVREDWWGYTESIRILHRMMEGRMYPLTLEGLDAGLKELS